MIGFRKLALLGAAVAGLASASPLFQNTSGTLSRDAGRYIVTLRSGLDASAVECHLQRATILHARSNSPMVEIGRRWSIGSWNAYSCTMDGDMLAQINTDDAVEFVELDSPITLMKHITQEDAPWGLGSISHRVANHTDFVYDSRAGEGTYAYILDSGLLHTHEEFEGRAQLGDNVVGGEFVDDLGHGTHVAGIIGGKTYGVAKNAQLISVKIFGEYESYVSDLLEGFQWAVQNITDENRQESSVISISAGGEVRQSVNRAIDEGFNQGVLTIVAAGNSDEDARTVSPASALNAITVGAIGRGHSRSFFSNWGDLVDIFAPGEDVMSAWIGSDQDSRTLSGTSMATPHISGLILYLKSIVPYRMKTPADSVGELQRLATGGVIADAKGSQNMLGFNGNGVVILAD
ncbi:oryzin precursor [Hypoxylon crocopeplum]|nr:oryzin precursor [Hypoxylon crocopeplum]